MQEHQFIVTMQLADDADPEVSRTALRDAIAYESATTDLIGLAETTDPGTYELPDGAVKVELVDRVPGGILVTRPAIDTALRQAIELGIGTLVLADGEVKAGRPGLEHSLGAWLMAKLAHAQLHFTLDPVGRFLHFEELTVPLNNEQVEWLRPYVDTDGARRHVYPEPATDEVVLHRLRQLWDEILESLAEHGNAWLQRSDNLGIQLVDVSTLRIELDPRPDPAPADEAPNEIEGETRTWICRSPFIGEHHDIRCSPEDPRSAKHADCSWSDWVPDRITRRLAHVLTDLGAPPLPRGLLDSLRQLAGIDTVSNGQPGAHGPDGWEQDPVTFPGIPRSATVLGETCPDGGKCHHGCARRCFRVLTAGPLSGVFPGDEWPQEITARWG